MAASRPAGDHEPVTADTSGPPHVVTRPRFDALRIVVVVVIVGAIIGMAWLIGERQGFGGIGQGGVNAELLPEVGEQAPELVTFDTDGNLVRLSDFRGQPVWLNFWGSWCPPCRAEFPDIQAAYETLQPQGLVMLGVAVGEDPLVALDYANRVGGTFPVLADPQYLAALIPEDEYPEARALVTSYTINNYPTHIFIDRDGTVSAVILSPMTFEQAVGYGEEILASPAG
jgi:peroxiredoxin